MISSQIVILNENRNGQEYLLMAITKHSYQQILCCYETGVLAQASIISFAVMGTSNEQCGNVVRRSDENGGGSKHRWIRNKPGKEQ